MSNNAIPLFERFPGLLDVLPYAPLADLPTPVRRLDRLGSELGTGSLYVKDDGCSGILYGGNKPRKLEFLLGDAVNKGATHVLTFGAAGSNHALATAIYARTLGLKSISMLMPQPNAAYVRRNLLMSLHCEAELHACGGPLESPTTRPRIYWATMTQMVRHRLRHGQTPVLIPPGGSSPLGTVGYVNAGLELASQIAQGRLPAPACVYVACGTLGTAAGLLLGLRMAGLGCRVIAVRVTTSQYANASRMRVLAVETNRFLHSLDSTVPLAELRDDDFDVRERYCGDRYAAFTPEGMAAVHRMRQSEGIVLDGTYTGKAFAALMADAAHRRLRDVTALFWNTLNSWDFSSEIRDLDYHDLPRPFHRYFEEPIQPLDNSQDTAPGVSPDARRP
jgi:1-aminocyclopropane-1-carboxylate deaminase/D-cysteine desulfhydrase-like pyridoxal-dependent ACC family enzyme